MEEKINEIINKYAKIISNAKIRKRMIMIPTYIFIIIYIVVGAALFMKYITRDDFNKIIVGFFGTFGILIALLMIIGTIFLLSKLNDIYSKKIIPLLLEVTNNSFRYRGNISFIRQEFYESRLYNMYIDKFSAEHLLEGSINNRLVKMSFIYAYNRQSTVFYGTIISFDVDISYKGRTIIYTIYDNYDESNLDESSIREFADVEEFDGHKPITTGNEIFDEIFATYSSDSKSTLSILTPELTEHIMKMYLEYKIITDLSIIDNKVYIALNDTDFFSINKNYKLQIEMFYKYILHITKFIEIIEKKDELKLN